MLEHIKSTVRVALLVWDNNATDEASCNTITFKSVVQIALTITGYCVCFISVCTDAIHQDHISINSDHWFVRVVGTKLRCRLQLSQWRRATKHQSYDSLRLRCVTLVQLPAVGVRSELVDKTFATDACHYTTCVVVSVAMTTILPVHINNWCS